MSAHPVDLAAIRTAATENFSMGDLKQWRTPEILSDAALELLSRDPRSTRFRAWLDEDILAGAGVTDFDKYRCDPLHEPPPLSIQLIDPTWSRDGVPADLGWEPGSVAQTKKG